MMIQSAMIRPAFTPLTTAMMVLGFVVFWPLGLAMLAYILWGERWSGWKFQKGTFARGCASARSKAGHGFGGTGNSAFDDWRKAELDRLEEERRKLDAMRAEFDAYMTELRRARDREEFDRFMANRKPPVGETVTDPGL